MKIIVSFRFDRWEVIRKYGFRELEKLIYPGFRTNDEQEIFNMIEWSPRIREYLSIAHRIASDAAKEGK